MLQQRLYARDVDNPYAKLTRDSKHYDAVCRNCHQAVRHKIVTAKASCLSCHVPTLPTQLYGRDVDNTAACASRVHSCSGPSRNVNTCSATS